MEIKTVDAAGIAFLTYEEGCVLHPYLDSNKIPTIGIGNTYWEDGSKVKMTDKPVTLARAVKLFRTVLKQYETAVWSLTRDDINQQQFNALTSLTYNIGVSAFKTSTVLRLVNRNPQDDKIKATFEMWHRTGNKQNVLLARRKREWALYFSSKS